MSSFFVFELMIYVSVALLLAFSYKKKGPYILFYPLAIVIIVISQEAPNMERTYEYVGFAIRFWKVPLAIGLGWVLTCLTCYYLTDFLLDVEQWNPQQSYLTFHGIKIRFYPILALLDGFLVLLMSLVAELHGAEVGVWIYYDSKVLSDVWLLNVHIRTLWAYGTAALVFNFFLRLADPFLRHEYLGKFEVTPFILFFVSVFGYFALDAIQEGNWTYFTIDLAIGGFVIILCIGHFLTKRITTKDFTSTDSQIQS
ncbi:MAG: hypothetical protein ACFFDT_39775 [Candidatus Hodarchaeota archaeon]